MRKTGRFAGAVVAKFVGGSSYFVSATKITQTQILVGLKRIAQVRPALHQIMEKRIAGQVVRMAWVDVLRSVPDAALYDAVINDMVHARLPFCGPNETDDMVPFNILAEVRRRYARKCESAENVLNRTRHSAGAMARVENDHIGRIGLYLAEDLKLGLIDRAVHDQQLNELCDWEFRSGPKPEWLDTYGSRTVEKS